MAHVRRARADLFTVRCNCLLGATTTPLVSCLRNPVPLDSLKQLLPRLAISLQRVVIVPFAPSNDGLPSEPLLDQTAQGIRSGTAVSHLKGQGIWIEITRTYTTDDIQRVRGLNRVNSDARPFLRRLAVLIGTDTKTGFVLHDLELGWNDRSPRVFPSAYQSGDCDMTHGVSIGRTVAHCKNDSTPPKPASGMRTQHHAFTERVGERLHVAPNATVHLRGGW
jgi:hypothetical protein